MKMLLVATLPSVWLKVPLPLKPRVRIDTFSVPPFMS